MPVLVLCDLHSGRANHGPVGVGDSPRQRRCRRLALRHLALGLEDNRHGLPVQISANKNVTCGWNYRVTRVRPSTCPTIFSLTLLANPGYADQPTEEIMIWLYTAGGAGPIGGVDSTTSIGGASWEVHKGSTGTWNVYSYVRNDQHHVRPR